MAFMETIDCQTLLVSDSLSLPAGCLRSTHFSTTSPVSASKKKIPHRRFALQQVHGSAATTERRVFFNCIGTTGVLRSVRAGVLVAAVGAATVTIDIYKNGSSVLSSVLTLDVNNAIRTEEVALLLDRDLAAGDLLEFVVVATAGGGTLPQGLYVQYDAYEDYA